jgi:hypothetical protein
MLSVIVIATIAFTISSILSSSSVMQKWFPEHYKSIDPIVFVIVAGMIIVYFSNFQIDISIWLIPVILFGLGYGLLLRTFGIKIDRPLIGILRRHKQ